EREIAKNISKEKGTFSVAEVLEELEKNSLLKENERKEVMKEINDWIKDDPFCQLKSADEGIKKYSFT
ncbi:MAG: hypothetical protein QW331_03490, partial [Candidatus Woesearchaeota archaeon]